MSFVAGAGGSFPEGAVTPFHGAGRSRVVATRETVSLVLSEDAPVPESDEDVLDLVLRLRGHLTQLGLAVDRPVGLLAGALAEARHLAATDLPRGFMPSRVYLRRLALSVQVIVDELLPEMPRTPACLWTPPGPPVLPGAVSPACGPTESEAGLVPYSVPWQRRSTSAGRTSPKGSEWSLGHRVPALGIELVAVVLRQIRRARPLGPQPMQHLAALDEDRFTARCVNRTSGHSPPVRE
ncbi:DUF6415 family natural product biosynthesis protein [Streptomyces sp. NPDC093510]|uniref:DUF6415 family natural product biosynthesis protein n=1 Tax=Streptomyces sp. NPDC093510 TaxID=3155199 RepID=UPI00342E2A0C